MKIINHISIRHGVTPGMVDVNSYELIDGIRDEFQIDRIALPWSILDAEDVEKAIEQYVCGELNAEMEEHHYRAGATPPTRSNTMTQTQHSATPWTNRASASSLLITNSYPDDKKYFPIAEVFSEIDATFIVTACNCHEELVKACDTAIGFLIAQGKTDSLTYQFLNETVKKAKGEL